jgi:Icc-related predicted phosphoesterase
MMRLFFVTDIHGSNRVYTKFLNSLQIYHVDAGIIGGDLTGKQLVPAIRNSDGSYSIDCFGRSITIPAGKNSTELSEVEKMLNDTGNYVFRTTPDEYARLREDSNYRDKVFEEQMLLRLSAWIDLAKKKLNGTSTKVYITGGNDDPFSIEKILRPDPPLIYCESSLVLLEKNEIKYEMISCGYANLTPWKCPRDISEQQLEKKLESMASKLRDPGISIFNFHVPPIKTSLDECARLDTSVDPPKVIPGQMSNGGSMAVRKIIEKYKPLLSLHGHIHESRGAEKLGRTLCLNPGSEYSEGVLRGVIVNLDHDKVKGYQFITTA